MNFGLIFFTLVDPIIVYIKIFCPKFFETYKYHFRIKKKGYMKPELHLMFSSNIPYSYQAWPRYRQFFVVITQIIYLLIILK
jgi:hypothetical protein